MSDIIQLLPDSVANQIAAGEVIQRPASIVKELVENAIDAGAENIHVLITDAGRTCVQVIDDGKGMSETDARLSFERHATSKIRTATDLFALQTMGFRGEALASIAAVAQVELRTRREEDELGTLITIAGSRVESQEPVSCPRGSSFSVKNLFYNVPVRRKFLKSNTTELSNILSEFERIVLVHPEVAFTLHHNDSEIFNLPSSSLRQRIVAVFGKKLNQQLLTIEVETTMVNVLGYIAKPEAARKKGAHQYFFVNGRYMRHPYFYKAITDAYEHLVPVGEQVAYFIYFDVDPASIDVNIHPTKTEIKFENEQAIWQILSAAIKEALGKFSAVPSIDFDMEGMPDIPVFNQGLPVEPPKVDINSDYNPFKSSGSHTDYSRRNVDWGKLYNRIEKRQEPDHLFIEPDEERTPEHAVVEEGSQYFQHKGRYLLTSVKSGLMVIDQHRAHVRVLFDQYMQQMKQRQSVSQGLLFPEMLQLPASEVIVLQEIMDDLSAIGFDLSDLGGGSYAINGIPSGIEGLNPVELVQNMVHTAMEKGKDVKEDIHSILSLTLARAAAIVYGQVLGDEEIRRLIDGLFACAMPNYTPDGQTILATLKEEEIEKLFR